MLSSVYNRWQRLGFIALIVLFVGQAGLLAHKVTAEHAPGAGCELCTQFDNQSAAPAAVSPPIFVVAAVLAAAISGPRFSPAPKFFSYFLRGPPSL